MCGRLIDDVMLLMIEHVPSTMARSVLETSQMTTCESVGVPGLISVS